MGPLSGPGAASWAARILAVHTELKSFHPRRPPPAPVISGAGQGFQSRKLRAKKPDTHEGKTQEIQGSL